MEWASSVKVSPRGLLLQTHHLSAMFQEQSVVFQSADDVQMMLSRAEPYSGAEPSAARFRPGTGKCKRAIPWSVGAHPESCGW